MEEFSILTVEKEGVEIEVQDSFDEKVWIMDIDSLKRDKIFLSNNRN